MILGPVNSTIIVNVHSFQFPQKTIPLSAISKLMLPLSFDGKRQEI